MAKIDRLGWTAGLAFKAYGTTVGVRTNDVTAVADIPDLLPPEWHAVDDPVVDSLFSLYMAPPATRKGQRNFHLLYGGAARLERTHDAQQLFETLENHLRITVAFWAKADQLFVHAGVVGWQGKAIVIPGRSFSGKTTLVSELIKAGATYYSDDMAVFDPQGYVHPYPVALSMRLNEGRQKVLPAAFGSETGQEPLPVGLIVVTHYEEKARWQPRPLTPGRALLALLDNTVAARKDPRVSLPILQQVVATAPAIKGKRGEAAAIAEEILQRVAAIPSTMVEMHGQ